MTCFPYDSLDTTLNEIRLLTIQPSTTFDDLIICELKNASLTLDLHYEALSYVWGDASVTKDINVNGLAFPVTTNLESALRYLREFQKDVGTSTPLWVDAISINQADVTERNLQVQRMAAIYGMASSVRAWLGVGSTSVYSTSTLSNTLYAISNSVRVWSGARRSNFRQVSPIINTILESDSDKDGTNFHRPARDYRISARDVDVLSELYDSPWWARLWVIQEAALAKSVNVHWGRENLILGNVMRGFMLLFEKHLIVNPASQMERVLKQLSKLTVTTSSIMFNASPKLLKSSGDRYTHAATVATLLASRYSQASNPRDKVYGLLGLLPDEVARGIVPDYDAPTVAVYAHFVYNIAAYCQNLSILMLAVTTSEKTLTNCPSWVPDWSSTVPSAGSDSLATSLLLAESELRAHGSTPLFLHCDGRTMGLKGLMVDVVEHVSGRLDLPYDLNKEDFQYYCLLHGLGKIGQCFDAEIAPKCKQKQNGDPVSVLDILPVLALDVVADPMKGLRRFQLDEYENLLHTAERLRSAYAPYIKYVGNRIPHDHERLVDFDSATWLYSEMARRAHGKRIFLTEHGFVGSCGDNVQAGDHLYVLAGGRLVYVLRPLPIEGQKNTFTLIDCCYVTDLMDGEAVHALRAKVAEDRAQRFASSSSSGKASESEPVEEIEEIVYEGWEDVYLV